MKEILDFLIAKAEMLRNNFSSKSCLLSIKKTEANAEIEELREWILDDEFFESFRSYPIAVPP